jgi:NADPH2:quinone reductase
VIGFTGRHPEGPLNLALLKGCQIVGVFLGAMTGKEPALRQEIERDLLAELAAGAPASRTSRGAMRSKRHRRPCATCSSARVVGKIVIEP